MSLNSYENIPEDEAAEIRSRINVSRNVRFLKLKEGNDKNGKPYRGKPFFVVVREEGNPTPFTKACETLKEAERTANEKVIGFKSGTDSAGRVDGKAMLDNLMARLTRRGRVEDTKHQVKVVIEAAIEYGLKNLKDPLIVTKAERFLETYAPRCGFGVKKTRAPRTYNKHLGILRQWAKEARLVKPKRLLNCDPFEGIERKEEGHHEMEVLTISECFKIATDEALARREGLHWFFRMHSCTRRREGTWIRWSHIDFESKLIRIRLPDEVDEAERIRIKAKQGKAVKRNKTRACRMDDELATELLKIRPADGGGDTYVFPESMRKRANNNEIKAFHNHLKACGVDRSTITPHELRSTGACIWAGLIDENRLVSHLGHGAKAMTRHYAEKLVEFEVGMKGWNGTWKLRSRYRPGIGSPTVLGSAETNAPLSPEDEIGDEWFVILPR